MRMFVSPVVTTGLLEFHSTTRRDVRLRSCDGYGLKGDNRQTKEDSEVCSRTKAFRRQGPTIWRRQQKRAAETGELEY